MNAPEPNGFNYRLSDEALRAYQAKPLALRLEWLYMGNLLRKALPARTRALHDRFRNRPAGADPGPAFTREESAAGRT